MEDKDNSWLDFVDDEDVKQSMLELLDDTMDNIGSSLRVKQLQFTYMVLRLLTRGKDVKVYYKLHEPIKTMGSVSVEANILEFDNPEWFSRAAEYATNTEVYALANGMVRITFGFHGLPVE